MMLSRILWVNMERERERERANYHSKIAGFLEPHHCVRVIERLFDLSKLCPLVIRQCNGFIPSKFGERERERERESYKAVQIDNPTLHYGNVMLSAKVRLY